MRKFIWTSIIFLSLFLSQAKASSVLAPTKSCDKSNVKGYIECRAKEYGFSDKLTNRIIRMVDCESRFIPQQSKLYYRGSREQSFGVWQIHLPAHKEVSREQAMDLEFSTTWSLNEIKAGNISQWSCYK